MIIGIHGILGTYKTWFLTMLAVHAHQKGKTIYSNYELSDIPYKPLDLDEVLTYNMQLRNCVIIVSELEMYFDARRSMSNTLDTYFIMQARKRNVDFLYDSQKRSGMVELRLRDQTNLLVYCDKGNKKYPNRPYIKFTIIDLDEDRIRGKIIIQNPKPIFHYYDSYKLFMPKGYGITDADIGKSLKNL